MYYFHPTFLLVLPPLLLAAYARSKVRATFQRYSTYPSSSGVTGAEAARTMQLQGFDVVHLGNADSFDYPYTLVVDRGGGAQSLGEVARAIGCGETLQQLQPEAYLDVTVVLGADYLKLPAFAGLEGGARTAPAAPPGEG